MEQELIIEGLLRLKDAYLKTGLYPNLYQPAERESPIEEAMYEVFRSMGLKVEPQIAFDRLRVDMIVSSPFAPTKKIIVECDGAEYHEESIDAYRDDVLLALAKMPIIHVSGSAIVCNAEELAAVIVKAFLPEHINTVGYSNVIEAAAAYPDHRKYYNLILEKEELEEWDWYRIQHGRDLNSVIPNRTMEEPDVPRGLYQRMVVRWVSGQTVGMDLPPSKEEQQFFAPIRQKLMCEGWHNRTLSFFALARLEINMFIEPEDREQRLRRINEFEERKMNRA